MWRVTQIRFGENLGVKVAGNRAALFASRNRRHTHLAKGKAGQKCEETLSRLMGAKQQGRIVISIDNPLGNSLRAAPLIAMGQRRYALLDYRLGACTAGVTPAAKGQPKH